MRYNPMIGSWEEVETNNRIAGKLAGGGRLGAGGVGPGAAGGGGG